MDIFNCKFNFKNIREDGYFNGYASVFFEVDGHNDIIMPGSFGSVEKLKLLWQHNANEPIGLIMSGYEDEYGLFVNGKILLDLQKGKEAYSLIKHKIIDGLSIGYLLDSYEYDFVENVRVITKVKLVEISLVTFPANTLATINANKDPRNTCSKCKHYTKRQSRF